MVGTSVVCLQAEGGAGDFSLYGWRIRADLLLEPVVAAGPVGEPDITVSAHHMGDVPTTKPEGTVLAEFPPGEAAGKMYWLVANKWGFLLRFPGSVEYRVSGDLTHVMWVRSPGVSLEHARELFRGHAMALLLGLAGYAVFHASAVVLPDCSDDSGTQAVAMVAASGGGKSTCAALLVAAGAKFLTDDVLCVATDAGGIVARGGCAEVRLRKTAGVLAELFAGAPARETLDDRIALTLGKGSLFSHPLGLLVFPSVEDGVGDLGVRRLTTKEVALRLAGSPRMSGWSCRRVLETQLKCLAKMAVQVPAVSIAVPQTEYLGSDQAQALINMVKASWQAG